ncbi:putative Endonuclease/exonuclease/phosphatase superfamily [Helianthus annuus]|nr:putative Endonuclease/exonuclease/phosphatase superfamily [Helianthus annuus]
MARDGSKIQFRKIWGRGRLEFDWVNAEGRSGGMACLWNPVFSTKTNIIRHLNFMVITGKLCQYNDILNFVNVYAPQGLEPKKESWKLITNTMGSMEGIWVLLGDFNAVRSQEERMNTEFIPSCAEAFNTFIEDNGLL